MCSIACPPASVSGAEIAPPGEKIRARGPRSRASARRAPGPGVAPRPGRRRAVFPRDVPGDEAAARPDELRVDRRPHRHARILLAALALGAGAVHAGVMLALHGAPPAEALWACHVAPVVLGIGCARGSARIASVGTTWLSLGLPLWIWNLADTGGAVEPTPALVHVGAFAVGLAAAYVLGWDRSAWWRASLALAVLAGLTRLVPAAEASNVNAVFRVWPGVAHVFPSEAAFLAALAAAIPAVFYLFGRAVGAATGVTRTRRGVASRGTAAPTARAPRRARSRRTTRGGTARPA